MVKIIFLAKRTQVKPLQDPIIKALTKPGQQVVQEAVPPDKIVMIGLAGDLLQAFLISTEWISLHVLHLRQALNMAIANGFLFLDSRQKCNQIFNTLFRIELGDKPFLTFSDEFMIGIEQLYANAPAGDVLKTVVARVSTVDKNIE